MLNRLSRLPAGLRRAAGAFAAAIGLGIVYIGLGVGTEGPKKEASARVAPAAVSQSQKPVRAMNLALGDMVFLAQDLGFSVAGPKGAAVEPSKIAARIESQLQSAREIYRREAAKNASLAGPMTLQLEVAASGEVAHVKELASRLGDEEFKKAILAEALKWSFADIVGETVTVTCPLLFVREGMDITTLVLWERSLGNFADKPAASRLATAAFASPQAKSVATSVVAANGASNGAAEKTAAAAAKIDGRELQIKYATVLRSEPNFTAAPVTSLTIGTRVAVLRRQGDWLEVRARPEGPSGFIRKEFVAPVDAARSETDPQLKSGWQRGGATRGRP